MIKGIIFDVDGVIINTENTHFLAFAKILKNYNYHLTAEDYKIHFSGKSIKGGITSLLSENTLQVPGNREQFIQKFITEKVAVTRKLFQKQIVYFDDTLGFIQKISSGNTVLKGVGKVAQKPTFALTTGLESTHLQFVLAHPTLAHLFSVQVTADQYTHSKPHPECYLLTLEHMKLQSKEVIGIEDSPAGIAALNSAGIYSIGLTNTHTQTELHGANKTIEALTELL